MSKTVLAELCSKLSARVPGARPRAKGRRPTLELKEVGKGCLTCVLGECPPPPTSSLPPAGQDVVAAAGGWAGCGGGGS